MDLARARVPLANARRPDLAAIEMDALVDTEALEANSEARVNTNAIINLPSLENCGRIVALAQSGVEL